MRLARNTAWILTGRLAGLLLSVLLTVVLARRLGLDGFAGYAILTAIVWLANVLTTFGTDMVLVREIASRGSVEAWRAGFLFQVALSFLAVAALWTLAPFLPWPAADGSAALRIVAVSLFPLAATSIATAVLRGIGAMGRYALVGMVAAAVPLATVWWLVPPGSSLVDVARVLVVAQTIVAPVSWGVAANRAPALWRPARSGRNKIVTIARASLPLGILGTLGMAFQRAPVIVTAALAGPAATAFVAAAQRIADGSTTGHVAFFSALLPELAAGRQPRSLRRAWRASFAASVALAIALLAVGPVMVGVLYGPAFAPAGTALSILALGIVPSTMATYRTLALVAARRERAVLVGLVSGVLALAVLLVTLVPTFGWAGACWAIVLAEVAELGALTVAERAGRHPAPADTNALPEAVVA